MNDLERLKRAEEAEPMAVLIMQMPECCEECNEVGWEPYGYCCMAGVGSDRWRTIDNLQERSDKCPLRPAIGIIEPNGHVVYLREEEEE